MSPNPKRRKATSNDRETSVAKVFGDAGYMMTILIVTKGIAREMNGKC